MPVADASEANQFPEFMDKIRCLTDGTSLHDVDSFRCSHKLPSAGGGGGGSRRDRKSASDVTNCFQQGGGGGGVSRRDRKTASDVTNCFQQGVCHVETGRQH